MKLLPPSIFRLRYDRLALLVLGLTVAWLAHGNRQLHRQLLAAQNPTAPTRLATSKQAPGSVLAETTSVTGPAGAAPTAPNKLTDQQMRAYRKRYASFFGDPITREDQFKKKAQEFLARTDRLDRIKCDELLPLDAPVFHVGSVEGLFDNAPAAVKCHYRLHFQQQCVVPGDIHEPIRCPKEYKMSFSEQELEQKREFISRTLKAYERQEQAQQEEEQQHG